MHEKSKPVNARGDIPAPPWSLFPFRVFSSISWLVQRTDRLNGAVILPCRSVGSVVELLCSLVSQSPRAPATARGFTSTDGMSAFPRPAVPSSRNRSWSKGGQIAQQSWWELGGAARPMLHQPTAGLLRWLQVRPRRILFRPRPVRFEGRLSKERGFARYRGRFFQHCHQRPPRACDMDLTEQPDPTGRIDDRIDCLDHGRPPL